MVIAILLIIGVIYIIYGIFAFFIVNISIPKLLIGMKKYETEEEYNKRSPKDAVLIGIGTIVAALIINMFIGFILLKM